MKSHTSSLPYRSWMAGLLGSTALALVTMSGAQAQQAQAPQPNITQAANMPGANSPVTADRLLNPDKEPQNWLTYHRNYAGWRFSPLDNINTTNVGNLHVAFTYPLGGLTGAAAFKHAALEATPLVNDGFMYVPNGWGETYKLDVRDGSAKLVWKMDPQVDKEFAAVVTCCDIDNRGVGLWQDKVASHTLDGRLILTDDATGQVDWQEQLAHPENGETITMAPLVIGDMAITGVSGAEKGIRGWLAATNLKTGKLAWKINTIPGPGDPGFNTWKDNHDAWKTGGGATWGNGTYDPSTQTLYWGTANPGPDFDPQYRPGDNLYTESLLALDVNTGKMKWHFQYIPGDPHDFDEIAESPLINANYDGQQTPLVVTAARDGIFYAFDRTNGKFLYDTPYVNKLTWTKGLDPKTGLPVEYDPSKDVQAYAANTFGLRDNPASDPSCPTTMGGKNWQPTAYNPNLHTIYVPVTDSCGFIDAKQQAEPASQGGTWKLPSSFTGAGKIQPTETTGSIAAIDVTTGKIAQKVQTTYPMWGGMLATAGGLVFTSTMDGYVRAYDAKTMKELWKFSVGAGINAPPMTYSVNGKQYVAILVGAHQTAAWRGDQNALDVQQPTSMLYVFAL
jgi:alcohol dehydrogenase (cytochrome c)